MGCHDTMKHLADLMKTTAGRVFLTLEQMEADREITTTEAIIEPLQQVMDGIKEKAA